MAYVNLILRVMPEDIEVDLSLLKSKVEEVINSFEGKGLKIEEEPVAFGLKSLKVMFGVDESKGGTDSLEQSIGSIEGVKSVEVVDVRRALG